MDGDLMIIAVMVIAVVGIIGGSVNGIVSKATAYYLEKDRRQRGEDDGTRANGQIAERTDMIEDRLRVLERLATDRGALLSDEIEKLRDERSARREKEAG